MTGRRDSATTSPRTTTRTCREERSVSTRTYGLRAWKWITSSSSNQVSIADQVSVNAPRMPSVGASGYRCAAPARTRSPSTTSYSSLRPSTRERSPSPDRRSSARRSPGRKKYRGAYAYSQTSSGTASATTTPWLTARTRATPCWTVPARITNGLVTMSGTGNLSSAVARPVRAVARGNPAGRGVISPDGPRVPARPHGLLRRPGQPHDGPRVRGHVRLDDDAATRAAPGDPCPAVRRVEHGLGVVDPGDRPGRDEDRPVPGLRRSQARDGAVQPVGDGAERVVVERRHLAGVDRAVL